MEIRELQIKNFGKFKDQRINFHSGINIIYGANEMGKTTMHSFIKGMFFGIEKLRGRASKNDEYTLREPWEHASHYAGTLRFESGGKCFRLDRNFNKKDKSVQLVCESDGEELSVPQGDLEVLMAGMGEAAFRNTVFFQQKGSATDEGLAVELQNYMSNMQNAGDSEVNVANAVSQLMEKRKRLAAQIKQETVRIQGRLQEVQMKLDYMEQEICNIRQEKQEYSRQIHHASERQQEFKSRIKSQKDQKKVSEKKRIQQSSLLWILGFVVLFICVFSSGLGIKILSLLSWMILFGCYSWKQMLDRKNKDYTKSDSGDIQEQLEQKTEELEQIIQKLRWNLEHAEENIKEKQIVYNNLKENLEEVRGEFVKMDRLEEEQGAVSLAITTLLDISNEIYKETAKQLNRRISEILSEITDGQYTDVYLDANMEIRINTPHKLLSLEQVSRGTMEQLYFALRMAAAKLLTQTESMPIILDDAFVMYDNERLHRTLDWLHRSSHQVILFTCHTREEEYLSQLMTNEDNENSIK